MNSGPGDGAASAQVPAGGYSVDARGGMGVQVGEGNTQIIYTYNRLTWTDGVAPPPLVSVSGAVDSPYRGLGAFEEQDAAFFFGREEAAEALLGRMSRLAEGRGLLVVSGVSGAGKSSLLRAGVLPRIRGTGLAGAPGATSWPCLVFTPGRAPLDELALRVGLLAGADAAAVRRGLEADPRGFALTARQAALAPPPGPGGEPGGPAGRSAEERRLLLVVDQFEQVFTQCPDEAQRRAFVTALCAAAGAAPGPGREAAALVVLGVRADFEARCANYPGLAGAVQDRYLVTGMTERQLRMAITEPAKTAGSRVDEDLVEVLLAEVRARQPGVAGAGVLPLLSHALDQAWRSRTGPVLTVADYERTGGIEGAVADSAQRAYDHLTPGQQTAARQVFTRLTAASSEGVDTADRASRAELTEGRNPAGSGDVEAVLEAFAGERLLTLAADSVEISHEVLLTAWPLLRDTWLTETHADRIIRTRLHTTAAEWDRQSRDPSYLYGGSLLQAAAETAARTSTDPARNPPLSQTERDFLAASDRARRRTALRRRGAIAILAALTLTASTTAVIAIVSASNVNQQRAITLSRQLAADSLATGLEPLTARQLAVAAWRVYPTAQAESAMQTLLAEQQEDDILSATAQGGVSAVAFSPDGRLLASADGDGTVRLWNPATGRPVGAPLPADPSGIVNGVAFSPDGTLLATADSAGMVRLWNPATGRPVGAPLHADTGPSGDVYGVAFSPDGTLLASADNDGTVRLWNPATGQRGPVIHAYFGGFVDAVAFNPQGTLLASGDADGRVTLWNPATGHPAGPTIQANDPDIGGVLAVAFNPQGTVLASADADGTVRLWNPATGHPAGPTINVYPDGLVEAVAFGPHGTLATADAGGMVQLWNPATGHRIGAPLPAVPGPSGEVYGVAFNPDGTLLASADNDGTVRLWNPGTGQPASTFLRAVADPEPGSSVDGLAFSPHGTLLATAEDDSTVQRLNPATGHSVGKPLNADPGGGVLEVAFSPRGTLLAAADNDGTVRLLNPATGHLVVKPLSASTSSILGVAFSPHGTLLATADYDGIVRLWNPATGHSVGKPLPADPGPTGGVNGIAFNPDGTLLATADDNGTVRLWNPATGQPVGAPLLAVPGATDGVAGVAFSPDGTLLATADADGTVRLWNPATGQPVGAPLPVDPGPTGGVNGVAFSPDGTLLATADADGTVRLWNPATGQPVGAPLPSDPGAEGGVGVVAFSPDSMLLASTDDNGTVKLWNLSILAHPYQALCADVGPPTRQTWNEYVSGEPLPDICA